MPFITTSNAASIVKQSEFNPDIIGDIYKKPIYIFSKKEIASLLAIKELVSDPEKYFNSYYTPIVRKDTFRYVYEGRPPAYHSFTDCSRLTSDYKNFEIPKEVVEKGEDTVLKFRRWFRENAYLLEKPDAFQARLLAAFGVKMSLSQLKADNSGSEQLDDQLKGIKLDELENRIDILLKEAGRYYYASEKNTTILKKWGKRTGLVYSSFPIDDNDTSYSEEEIKVFLRDYVERFKKPLRFLLIEYYKVKHNPKMEFQGALLDQLGFKYCRECETREAGAIIS